MAEKNYSWKGSWNAGKALLILSGVLTLVLFASAFIH